MHASDVLKYGHLTVMSALEGLREEDWYTPDVCGWWSVKDIIAHLTSFEHVLVDVLNTILDVSGPTHYLDDVMQGPAEFNDVEVAKREHWQANDVLEEYKDAQARTMVLLSKVPHDLQRQTGILPWYGAEYDFEDYLAYGYYGHKREHCAQINVFKDSLVRVAQRDTGRPQ